MSTLFPIANNLPEGFQYVPDFIRVDEEQYLFDEISKIALHTFVFQGYEAKRRVASFGQDWSFEKQQLSKGKPIPEAFMPLIEKVAAYLSIDKQAFAEFLITEYPTGSVINWHRDAPPFDLIAGLSLLSDCTFRLRPYDNTRQGRRSIISFPVKRRSLYIIQGPARSAWQHSIAPVKQARYSLTLRTLKNGLG